MTPDGNNRSLSRAEGMEGAVARAGRSEKVAFEHRLKEKRASAKALGWNM